MATDAEKIKEGIKEEGGIFGIANTIGRKIKEWKTYRDTDWLETQGYDYDIEFGHEEEKEKKIAGIPKTTFWLLFTFIVLLVIVFVFLRIRKIKSNKAK